MKGYVVIDEYMYNDLVTRESISNAKLSNGIFINGAFHKNDMGRVMDKYSLNSCLFIVYVNVDNTRALTTEDFPLKLEVMSIRSGIFEHGIMLEIEVDEDRLYTDPAETNEIPNYYFIETINKTDIVKAYTVRKTLDGIYIAQ